MRVLYLSYDGMTDPLGNSQVIPYVRGLVRRGHEISIVSCEKPERLRLARSRTERRLAEDGIDWHPLTYHKRPPVFSTVWDVARIARESEALHRSRPFDAVHCRSYVTSLVGMRLKRRHGMHFIFDARGFWADERVDGGLWNLRNPFYRRIYKFFKSQERQFLSEADATVVLTRLAREEILRWGLPAALADRIDVIPCCTDLDQFSRERVDPVRVVALRRELALVDDDFTVVYLGSIGTWYMLPEMLAFFRRLQRARPNARLLFVTPDSPSAILDEVGRQGIDPQRIVITRAVHSDVPNHLALAQLGLFFIKPTYSKMSSCPTKLGELLAMGLPVVTNSRVGDSGWLFASHPVGAVVDDFDEASYDRAVERVDALLALDPAAIRQVAVENFSLENGVAAYERIYRSVAGEA